MSSLKPITLYSHASGPNPWKCAIILEELKVPYENKIMDFADLKKPPFEEINPNGRVPVIRDPNTGITLWESGAINQYLIETYDKNNSLAYAEFPQKHHCNQWLHFQMSGQGPYYGQAIWFGTHHPEKVQSAVDRYVKEAERVIYVLDSHLKKQGTPYLVGDKCTYADLAFVPWGLIIPLIAPDGKIDVESKIDVEGKYPNYDAWMKRLLERPTVKKVLEDRTKAISGH